MNLPLGAQVYCTDGHYGCLSRIVLNPRLEWVTHLVVKEGDRKQIERMFSVKYIEKSTTDKIYLNCAREGASNFQMFEITRYVLVPAAGSDASIFWSIDRQAEHYFPTERTVIPIKSTALPLNAVAVNQHARVKANNGTVGRLYGLLVNPSGWKITHLVLQRRHIGRLVEINIPVSEIKGFEENIVHLKRDKKTTGHASRIPTG